MVERYRVNTPDVVSEVVDGEAIIMRLDTGSYYSLADAGALAWRLLGHSLPVEGVIERVAGAYAGNRDEISGSIRDLVERLVKEGLLAPTDDVVVPPETPAEAPPPSPLPAFAAPVLNEYTDMQDLLLVDPIHEVEEGGWPKAVPDPAD